MTTKWIQTLATMDPRSMDAVTTLQTLLLNTEDFADLLIANSKGAFTLAMIQHQLDGGFCVTWDDEQIFAILPLTHQCDACGNIHIGKGRMLACRDCKTSHYCSRGCQKLHWKAEHKMRCREQQELSKTHCRVAEMCLKLLSILCINWESPSSPIEAENNFVYNMLKERGYSEHVYVPVCDGDALCFVPMPVETLSWITTGYKEPPPCTEQVPCVLISNMVLCVPVWTQLLDGDPVLSQVVKMTRVSLPHVG